MSRYLKLIAGLIVVLAGLTFIANCGKSSSSSANDSQTTLSENAPALSKTNFMTGLQNPWDMAFTPEGDLIYTERCLGLSVRKSDGQIVRLFGISSVSPRLTAPDLFCEGQSGANGVALDPDFANNRTVYMYMASNISNPKTNRVVRLLVSADYSSVTNRSDIVTDIAYKNAANNWGGAGVHSGGRVRFGPDGLLYITTGDNHNGLIPQDLHLMGGKVLRVDRNGAAAAGNNTPGGGDPRIFTYGHRNVQGICFQPGTDQVFTSEHGPDHSDEVTRLRAGGNSGWDPKPDPGVTCQDNYCGYISNSADGTLTPMTDLKKFPDAMKPVLSQDDSQGMGPCTFLSGSQWKSWDRAMWVGLMGGTRVDVLQISNDGILTDKVTAPNLPAARMRSTVQGPDGNLYIATDEGEIWKVAPAL